MFNNQTKDTVLLASEKLLRMSEISRKFDTNFPRVLARIVMSYKYKFIAILFLQSDQHSQNSQMLDARKTFCTVAIKMSTFKAKYSLKNI